ncbi:GrpB family protein [Gryllotalpicola protaetiae]|uniref:GrpB family protein n=1 Tax=Gryllotalpicola protaetiae TaxID=2419771 RepID=A0A387C2M0_9MICO|nr:GrpB family protein [Gryllotalpicola protaetiae]AYG04771.1 GrpB family protein [Gryllotalpicola protaetiae]
MIELVNYDSDWPTMFAVAAAELRRIEPAWLIEHMGSTSVPGLIAKPLIDIAVRRTGEGDVDRHRASLEELGWSLNAGGPANRVTFVRRDAAGNRTHHAHFFRPELWEGANQRIFRDWLLTHDDERELYAAAKRAAAAESVDGADYTKRKTAVVQQITNRARAARGLPPVDVWEK